MKKVQLNSTNFNTPGKQVFFAIALIAAILLLLSAKTKAQPYLDIVNLKYTNSPNAGVINQNKRAAKIQYFSVSTNLPVQFKNKKDAVIFSPFYEKWWVKIDNNTRQSYSSVALPVTPISTNLPLPITCDTIAHIPLNTNIAINLLI